MKSLTVEGTGDGLQTDGTGTVITRATRGVKQALAALSTTTAALVLGTQTAFAQNLPAPQDPSLGAQDDNYVGFFIGTARDVILGIIGIVMTVAFIFVAMGTFKKYQDVMDGRGTWAGVGASAAFGVALLLGAGYLLGDATGIIALPGAAAP